MVGFGPSSRGKPGSYSVGAGLAGDGNNAVPDQRSRSASARARMIGLSR